MKKYVCVVLMMCAVCVLPGTASFAKVSTKNPISSQVSQKVEQADNRQQIGLFMEKLAQKEPAKVAQLLLQYKYAYVYDESITYIGVKANGEVLVICHIDDSDVGAFYYSVHKAGRVTENTTATPPSTQGFATLFAR